MTAKPSLLRRLGAPVALLIAAGTLAACQVDVDRSGGYAPGPQACTREYAPVCGARGRDRQSFANACEARRSGYDVIGRGECRSSRPDHEMGRRDRDRQHRGRDRRDNQARQRMCTMEYNPVCARRGQDMKTFGNACSADGAGYRVVRPGECRAY